jgi:nitroimidazol reductase NimA-like FMN-containing flavoprotein (pyridoxamine 5'-phosphate oxidase superfamily)
VSYVFQDGRIYFHSAPQGEKIANLIHNPRVGFEVDIPLAYLGFDFNPEKNPCRAHQLYRSVVIRGKPGFSRRDKKRRTSSMTWWLNMRGIDLSTRSTLKPKGIGPAGSLRSL